MSNQELLARVPMFSVLSNEELAHITMLCRRKTYDRGETIFRRDDPASSIHVITKGRVKISLTSPEGQETVLAFLFGGEFFGELALFDGQPRSADATAVEDTEVLTLTRNDFLNFVLQNRQTVTNLLALLAQRLRETNDLIGDIIFLDVGRRMAKKLLEMAEKHGQQEGKTIVLNIKLTQADLAAMIGTTRESVNKQLRILMDEGYISMDKQHIVILKPNEMRVLIG